ncbi:hypothetical protein HX057_03870 [Myroides odoratimimus]|uniref:BfmA/BtgA family mobilization protein n=1 Tax=Myroides odoratimimus TaxID=76832 RepID=UPI002577BA78|nr:BfmA/BtgA family mobilization protein [Myroides odoratimimus]MDM1445882.1 hypothetical protein [Myroides odoratimimus]
MQDFKDTSIRIKGSTKNKLDKICREYQYKKINECVVDMIDFFIQNGLSPKSNINLNIQSSIDKINRDFINRDDSFRKWFGDLYHKKIDRLMKQNETIASEVGVLLHIAKDKLLNELREEIAQEKAIEEKKESNHSPNINDDYFEVLQRKELLLKKEKETQALLKIKLKNLLDKAEKKTGFSTSFVIKLSKNEYDDLKKISL